MRKKEALVWCKSVYFFITLTLCCFFEGRIRNRKTTIISNIFSFSQFPVQMESIHGNITVILVDDIHGALFKSFGVFSRPPVFQVAVCIILAPLVVKTMGDLMSDHEANPAIVHRIVSV